MLLFETCPRCSQLYALTPNKLKPMVLSGCETQMQCDVCNHSFKLPDSEGVLNMARRQRDKKYADPSCSECGGEGRKDGVGDVSGCMVTCSCVGLKIVLYAKEEFRR